MNEDLLLRQAPHSPGAEQAVLGSMLIDADCVKLVMDKLRPDDFYLRQNREIFAAICSMFAMSKPIDGLTVAEELRGNAELDETATRSYLAQLMEITPTSANVMEYAKIVADRALLRAAADTAAEILSMSQGGGADGADVLEAMERRVYAIRNGRGYGDMTPLKEIIPGVLDRIGEMSESESHLPGLSTGLSAIDRKIMGLNKSDLIILAARPGMGKTALALNVALSVAKSAEQAVAVFSLEMSREQLATRLLSAEALVDGKAMRTGKDLLERDWEKIAAATVTLSRLNIQINDNPALTVAEMSAKCRRIDNLGLVVIDYLQLIRASGAATAANANRQQVVSDMSRMLKIMAKELNVPVLCLSQLSRMNELRGDKRPQLSDLRDSGAIEQDADVVMFLYREGVYKPDTDNPDIAECIIAKNRRGETGVVKLRWMGQYTMFSALEEWHSEQRGRGNGTD